MLKICLTRVGKKKQPFYRIIVTEKSRDPWGKFLEILGNYNPRTKEKDLKAERIKYWISKGAQPSPTLHNMLVDEKIIEAPKVKTVRAHKKKKTNDKPANDKEEKKEKTQPEIQKESTNEQSETRETK